MSEISNYRCMSCGGSLKFSSEKQKLLCESCGTEYDVSEYEAAVAESGQQDYQAKTDEWDIHGEGLVVYECRNCNGEAVGDETMASTKCPYCESPIVISSKFEGSLKPDLVIPFQKDKKAAESALREHVNKIKLAPAKFKMGNHIKEVKGVYVPFWLFDADVHASAQYEATKVEKHSDAKYQYKETSYFDVYREGDMRFENVPADASKQMDDKLMDSIEPYDVSAAVPYSSAYMAGYLANRYDVTAEECQPRADERMKSTAKDMLRGQVKDYNTVSSKKETFDKVSSSYKYALYPVWILNTFWNGNKYVFAMNGQSGKLVGDVPYSKGKFWGVLLGVLAAIWGILFAILAIKGNIAPKGIVGTLVIALIIALIVAFSMKGKTKTVHKGTRAMNFVKNGSFKLTNQHDNFLKKNVEKTEKSS